MKNDILTQMQEICNEDFIEIKIPRKDFIKITKSYVELQEENETLNDILETQRKRQYYSKFLKDFQKENGKNVSPDFDEIYKRYDGYKERISNAIEYIKHLKNVKYDYIHITNLEDILGILKGEDNE